MEKYDPNVKFHYTWEVDDEGDCKHTYSAVVRMHGELHDLRLFTRKQFPVTEEPDFIECHGDKCRLYNKDVICRSCSSATYSPLVEEVTIAQLSSEKCIPGDYGCRWGEKAIINRADRLEVTEYVPK
jgi:hypothetical protein